MKILIIQTAFLGDVILATPVIEKIHQYFPTAQIDFLLRKGNESLLNNHPHLRQVLIFDKQKNKYQNLRKLIQQIRATRYDRVINLQRFFSSGLITALSAGKLKSGFDKNPLSFFYDKKIEHRIAQDAIEEHEVKRNLALIQDFTDAAFIRPKLYPSEADFAKTKRSDAYVSIAPASIWFTKQFPKAQWVKLIQALDDRFTICLLGGKADVALCQSIKAQVPDKKIEILAGKLSLLASAALMKHARMNYVNDSAPLHLASAMNAPVMAIFCSTVPAFGFGPLSEKAQVLETHHQLDCRPCGLHGKRACPEGHFRCSEVEIPDLAF